MQSAATGDREGFLRDARLCANWMLGDFARLLHAHDIEIGDAKVSPEQLYAMIFAVREGKITGAAAKTVFEEMFATGKGADTVIRDLGLEPIGGDDEISAIVDSVIARNPKAVADFNAGKQEAIKFLVGQAMRETRGLANPNTLADLLTRRLSGN
jgi:aspartyl-tRNA(Asn)/glutamyl-tRNA(Gln) amidotransferase subunit B